MDEFDLDDDDCPPGLLEPDDDNDGDDDDDGCFQRVSSGGFRLRSLEECIPAFVDVSLRRRVPRDAPRQTVTFSPAQLRILREEPYLGSIMTANGTSHREVSSRIQKASNAKKEPIDRPSMIGSIPNILTENQMI